MREPRMAALVAAAVLAVAFIVVVVATTPWRGGGDVPPDWTRDFSAAEHDRSEAYLAAVRLPSYLSLALSLVLGLVLALTPWGARLVGWAGRLAGGGWVATVLLGGLAVLLVLRLATLGLSAWAESVRRSYGISTRTWLGWLADVGRSFAVSAVLTLIVLLVLFTLIRRFEAWWWVSGAVAGAVLVVVVSFLYPLVVEPVFNKFTPLPEGELRSALLDMAERDGVPVQDVLVADASRRTSTLNAYVSGFGATRRIVVYDNLLEQDSPEEVELVVAHELGHVKNQDVRWGTLVGALGMAAAVCFLGWLLGSRGLLSRAGVDRLADPRSLALILGVVAVLMTVTGPLQNLVSRQIEARADQHALDLTEDPETFTRMQRSLATASLSDLDPNPVVYALFASHPSAPERIAMARDWANEHGVPEPPDLVPVERP